MLDGIPNFQKMFFSYTIWRTFRVARSRHQRDSIMSQKNTNFFLKIIPDA